MKKEYSGIDVEIIRLACEDVIRTSGGETVDPGVTPEDAFDGGYDINGWT